MIQCFLTTLLVVALSVSAKGATSVESVGMTVSDMDRAVEFYSALTFQKISDVEVLGEQFEHLEGVFGARMRIVRMQLGKEYLDLTQYLAPPGRPIPVDSRSNDLWFQHIAIVVRDMDQAFDKLPALKVQFVSTGPQTLPPSNKAAAGIKAFYFRDPDQHNLEIIYFPPRKGDPRWQEQTDNLFLGIDHTAIGISSTDASLHFYRDLLGLRRAGESENFGTEQEHLNQVFGVHLRITGMRADSGPGVEFLEYLTPRDGRTRPADVHANDIVHWQTMIVTDEVDLLAKKLRDAHVSFVSPGVVAMPKEKAGFSKGERGFASAFPVVVADFVLQDSAKPTAHCRSPAKAVNRPHRGKERLLNQVLCDVGLAYTFEGVAIENVPMIIDPAGRIARSGRGQLRLDIWLANSTCSSPGEK